MRFRIGFNGYSVKFSPFEDGRLAVASAQNFGIIGNGRQHVLQVRLRLCLLHKFILQPDSPLNLAWPEQMTQQGLREVAAFDTQDGVYDCAWSEVMFAFYLCG